MFGTAYVAQQTWFITALIAPGAHPSCGSTHRRKSRTRRSVDSAIVYKKKLQSTSAVRSLDLRGRL